MQRGDARRWASKGKPFSYILACPKCGRACMYLAEDMGLEEQSIVVSSAPFGLGAKAKPREFEHPEVLTSSEARVTRCHGCAGRLRATGRELTLTPLTVAPTVK